MSPAKAAPDSAASTTRCREEMVYRNASTTGVSILLNYRGECTVPSSGEYKERGKYTHRGGYTAPSSGRHPPLGRLGRHPPGQTPPRQTPPQPDTPRQTIPCADTAPRQTPQQTPPWADPTRQTPWADTSPQRWPLQRTVRILLECILVLKAVQQDI